MRGLFGLWIVSLGLAVTGLVVVDIYRASLKNMIEAQGRTMLGGDVTLSARRLLSDGERDTFTKLLPANDLTRVTDLTAMASTARESRLVSLRLIDDAYPLVGDLVVDEVVRHGADLGPAPRAWVAPELLPLMGLNVGDALKIGELSAVIDGVITREAAASFRFGALAPRVLVHRRHLTATGLVRFGSTLTDTVIARLSQNSPTLRARVESALPDPALEVSDPRGLERGPLRVLSRLLDALGLIGLVTLTLGWIGVYFLGRRWLTLEAPDVARLKFLGVEARALQSLLLIKLAVVMTAGVALGGGLSWAVARTILPWFRDALPSELELRWAWGNVLTLLAVGPVAGFALLFEVTRATAFARPVIDGDLVTPARPKPLGLMILIGLTGAIFAALTLAQARSWVISAAFLGVLAGALLLTAGLGWLAVLAARAWQPRAAAWWGQLILAQWHRRPFTTVLILSVGALATLLAQVVPHLERTLLGSLDQPAYATRPALFLFDIQDDQVEPLARLLIQNHVRVSRTAPLVRARILSINGAPFERRRTDHATTREEETDASFRNRGVNLSYRTHLADGETIQRGKAWAEMTNGPPADISVEAQYAERVGLKLGDAVTFDVQGLELPATVANLRAVDWNSFEPNFFIQFASGVLNDAPKTWITTVASTAELDVTATQRLISTEFPNVSVLDVRRTIAAVAGLVEKVGRGLRVAGQLTLGLGTFVILMIVYFQITSGVADWRQLRWLGLSPRQIWGVQLSTFGGLIAVGTLLGSGLAVIAATALARYAFAAPVRFDWSSVVVGDLMILVVTAAGVSLAGRVR